MSPRFASCEAAAIMLGKMFGWNVKYLICTHGADQPSLPGGRAWCEREAGRWWLRVGMSREM
jgi:hypothetical protein